MTLVELLTVGAAAVGLIIGLCTLGGLLVRYALLPWLREHIVAPVQETNRQVTVNRHVSPEPTLLDKVDNIDIKADTLARLFDGHIDRSSGEWGRIWAAIRKLQQHDHREDTP